MNYGFWIICLPSSRRAFITFLTCLLIVWLECWNWSPTIHWTCEWLITRQNMATNSCMMTDHPESSNKWFPRNNEHTVRNVGTSYWNVVSQLFACPFKPSIIYWSPRTPMLFRGILWSHLSWEHAILTMVIISSALNSSPLELPSWSEPTSFPCSFTYNVVLPSHQLSTSILSKMFNKDVVKITLEYMHG